MSAQKETAKDLDQKAQINQNITEIIQKYYLSETEKIAEIEEKPKNISEWLREEGFNIANHNNKKEYFRFIAQKNTAKTKMQYVFELADYGKRISNIKILIL